MLNDMIHPIPLAIKASDLLKPLLPDEEPTIDKSVELADKLKQEKGLFVTPSFLLDVWMTKRKGADHE